MDRDSMTKYPHEVFYEWISWGVDYLIAGVVLFVVAFVVFSMLFIMLVIASQIANILFPIYPQSHFGMVENYWNQDNFVEHCMTMCIVFFVYFALYLFSDAVFNHE